MNNNTSFHRIFALMCLLWTPNIGAGQSYLPDTSYLPTFKTEPKIIFKDDFSGDQPGTMPRKWKIKNYGQGVQSKDEWIVEKNDGRNVLKSKVSVNQYVIEPNILNSYLRNEFSIEYSLKMSLSTDATYFNFLSPTKTVPSLDTYHCQAIKITGSIKGSIFLTHQGVTPEIRSFSHTEIIQRDLEANKWYHFALSYQDGTIQCFLDKRRILTIQDCGYSPEAFFLTCSGIVRFKDIIISTGGTGATFDSLLSTPKFVTHAINFDVNKATIKPESDDFLVQLAEWLKKNPGIKFQIGGQTDGVGSPATNLKLSQNRADAVMAKLVALGVAAARLRKKGYGATKPPQPNTTENGRANNRRVEFIIL